jgi:hypothetical protein
LQAEPGIIFTTVAQTLARRWKELPSVEKERYGELAKQYKQAKKQQLVQKIARYIYAYTCKLKISVLIHI